MCYFATVLCFIFVSWKLFTTVATSPILVLCFVVPSKVFDSKVNTRFGLLHRNRFLCCHESGPNSL